MSNEAAERLREQRRNYILDFIIVHHAGQVIRHSDEMEAMNAQIVDYIEKEVAAERKATVERIRAAFGPDTSSEGGSDWPHSVLMDILDAEAAREGVQ